MDNRLTRTCHCLKAVCVQVGLLIDHTFKIQPTLHLINLSLKYKIVYGMKSNSSNGEPADTLLD